MTLIKMNEAAKILGMPRNTLRNWAYSGRLLPDFVSPAGYRYYERDRIEAIKVSLSIQPKEKSDGSRSSGANT